MVLLWKQIHDLIDVITANLLSFYKHIYVFWTLLKIISWSTDGNTSSVLHTSFVTSQLSSMTTVRES